MSASDVIDAVVGGRGEPEESLRVIWRGNDCLDFITRRLTFKVKRTSHKTATCTCVEYAQNLGENCSHGKLAMRIFEHWHAGKRAKWQIPFTVPIMELDTERPLETASSAGDPLRPLRGLLVAAHGGVIARGVVCSMYRRRVPKARIMRSNFTTISKRHVAA